jgi:hypothetical protein
MGCNYFRVCIDIFVVFFLNIKNFIYKLKTQEFGINFVKIMYIYHNLRANKY